MGFEMLFKALLALLAFAVTGVAVPYIKSRTSATQQAEIAAWVKIAVSAAEQIFRETGMGKAKKEYVTVWLQNHGVAVDEDKLDALIESAVYQLKEAAGV